MRMLLILSACLSWAAATQAGALSPAELRPPMTSEESDYYASIKADAAKAQGFLATRAYERTAQAVVDGKVPATSMPNKPPGFSVEYLLPDEPEVINKALGMYISATLIAHPELLGR